jgi:hypothetical protein
LSCGKQLVKPNINTEMTGEMLAKLSQQKAIYLRPNRDLDVQTPGAEYQYQQVIQVDQHMVSVLEFRMRHMLNNIITIVIIE